MRQATRGILVGPNISGVAIHPGFCRGDMPGDGRINLVKDWDLCRSW
jgi:hypothetical protein